MRGLCIAAVTLLTIMCGSAAHALSKADTGIFVAVGEDGEPIGKTIRISQTPVGWKFEDRQPDGSWLDVSCHGGCAHRESRPDDLVDFFGSEPPPGLKPECVQNEQYAFCHFVQATPGQEREGYVLVVRVSEGWLPVSMLKLPGQGPEGEDEAPKLKLEAA